MDHICMAIPVLAGRTEAARTFLKQLDGPRLAEFDASERRIGIIRELWYLAKLPGGDTLVGYMEAANFGAALQAFVASRDPFDMWFKSELASVTGVDLNNPPADMAPAELLSHYETAAAV